jgi:hypothetical protein
MRDRPVSTYKWLLQSVLAWSIRIVAPLCATQLASAQLPGTAFWKHRSPLLAVTTTAQSIYASNCSGFVTVETQNSSQVATNVSSNLTVSLSGAGGGLTFYSDQNCQTSVSSVTVTSGTSSALFYFIGSANGSATITATAPIYTSISQVETIATNPFVWTGGGGNANWSTAGNWSGGAAPSTTAHFAVFNGTCSANCSPNINATIDIGGLRMALGYAGIITQNAGVNVSIRTAWTTIAGTFQGSGSADSINIYESFLLAGGTFNAAATTVNLLGSAATNNSYWIVSGGTFNRGTSTLVFNPLNTFRTIFFTVGSEIYNNVTLAFNNYGDFVSITGNMNVQGTLTGNAVNSTAGISAGTILASGDIVLTNYGVGNQIGLVKLVKNSSQSISASGSNCAFGQLEIASTGGTVFISGTINLWNNYKVTSGTLNVSASSLIFNVGNFQTLTATVGSEVYNNVTLVSTGYVPTLTLIGNMNIQGTLTGNAGDGSTNVNGGTILVTGNVVASSFGFGGGTSNIKLTGSTAQTITATGAATALPNLEIASSSTATLSGAVKVSSATIVTSGTTALSGASASLTTLSLALNSNTLTRNGGAVVVNSVTVPAGTQSLYGGTIAP